MKNELSVNPKNAYTETQLSNRPVTAQLTPEEELSLTASFQSADELDDSEIPPMSNKNGGETEQEEPSMTSPEWSDFVLRQFTEDELDNDGRPLVAGLRRVARLLLGPILSSEGKVVQAPQLLNNFEKLGFLQPATVEYRVVILMSRDVPDSMGAYQVTFGDAADVYHGNCDADFARHATAMAMTRAEARCFRKALQLKGIASEEKTTVPSIEAALDGMITPSQMNFLNVICHRNKIDIMKFINCGKKKYDSVYNIEAGVAAKMVEHLCTLENTGNIPDNIRLQGDK